jgi:hypothetical protein
MQSESSNHSTYTFGISTCNGPEVPRVLNLAVKMQVNGNTQTSILPREISWFSLNRSLGGLQSRSVHEYRAPAGNQTPDFQPVDSYFIACSFLVLGA